MRERPNFAFGPAAPLAWPTFRCAWLDVELVIVAQVPGDVAATFPVPDLDVAFAPLAFAGFVQVMKLKSLVGAHFVILYYVGLSCQWPANHGRNNKQQQTSPPPAPLA